ncbi:hypothetical protein PCASD_13248 [Puccinia coronata f. sp. avenae]|uniref:Uncharacterized protein n=1 Tax=Puccinia coronata f. sp. avenae TaxID=200324 RepID=A0A2N5S9X3_9BASI|nr:hypothetical protein PCASD_23936 [Puccinia coronata f. sp. avenae]PLW36793.1 hypothetical protein PCASD_13248 [Puccinia coronata f. sp. avenae]
MHSPPPDHPHASIPDSQSSFLPDAQPSPLPDPQRSPSPELQPSSCDSSLPPNSQHPTLPTNANTHPQHTSGMSRPPSGKKSHYLPSSISSSSSSSQPLKPDEPQSLIPCKCPSDLSPEKIKGLLIEHHVHFKAQDNIFAIARLY